MRAFGVNNIVGDKMRGGRKEYEQLAAHIWDKEDLNVT